MLNYHFKESSYSGRVWKAGFSLEPPNCQKEEAKSETGV